jgi:chromosome segregation protein
MYLKSLEVVGFKSFAEPTLIAFDRGVTAIVGPNGCGKSNVLDSIRWVLGEQSAKALRGGNMQDVIFSGTDSRRALGMAEVTMHFAECEKELGTDYHEVRITRRVFRDGRSEYEINKTPCRLKDIHMLFMDTGIGRSAYSIMEQGKIDKILSAKPDDRREVFEEAAGITKFKAQKKEALRKLEATEANLIRVGDITKELSRQIGSLQRQASKARRYKEIHGRLGYLDTRLAAHLYAGMKERLDTGEARVQQLQLEFQSIQQELDGHESALLEKRRRAEELEIEIRSLTQQRSLAESNVEKARQAIAFNEQRIAELEAEQERGRADIAATGEKTALLEEAVERARGGEESMQAVLSRIGGELATRSAELEAARKRVAESLKERTRLEQQIAQADKQLNSLRQRVAAMELQQRSYVVRVEKLAEEEKVLAERGAGLQARADEARARHAAFEADWKAKQEEAKALAAEGEAAARALDGLRRTADESAAMLARKESRCAVLAEILGSRAGYSDITKDLLSKFQGQGVLGTLLDQMEVDPGHAKAVQRALGTAWEALIVESREATQAIAEVLHEKGATAVLADLNAAAQSVAPPSAAKGGLLQKIALNFFGTKVEDTRASVADPQRAALHFVKASEKVRPLVERILEEFLVAADAAEAAVLRQAHPHCHVVTRSGEVWFRNGLQVRGDDASAIASIIEQEGEWKQLKAELPGLQQADETHRAAVDQARAEMQRREARLQEIRKAAQELEGGAVSARYEVEGLERQIQEWKTAQETVSREKVHLSAQESEDQSGRSGLEAQLKELETQRQQASEAAEALVASLAGLNAEVERCSQTVTEVRVDQAAQQQKAQTIRQELQAAEARLQEVLALRARREEEVAAAESRIAEAREAIARAGQEIEACQRQAEELAQIFTQRADERQALAGHLGEIEEQARSGRRKAGEVQSVCGREEVQVAEQRMKLDALVDRIRRAYELDLATLDPATLRPPAPEPKLKKSAAELDVPDLSVSGEAPAEPVEPSEAPSEAETNDPSFAKASEDKRGPMSQDDAVAYQPVQEPEQAVEDPAPQEIQEDPLLAVEPIDWEAVAAEVNELRDRIERMGPVNVEAITEYEELEQRLSFLAAQEQDLIKSRDQLHEAIRKINETTRTMFAETFEKIKANFAEMFVELFGGGKAELTLLDSEDPLECGIEIVARPPGKQLQSITLLSGGEKTMTAVALLFAIYMVKPSPFCFLDEMDAPLDESNINRFIRILQRFVTQSQFVVITHNKRTISSADVLYGVTMEEHGVSKIVSVRLSRKEESPLFNGNGPDDSPPSIADSIRHGELRTAD